MEDGQRHAPSIGIDLGTTCMRVAVYNGSQYTMIQDEHGYSDMPFYVAFTDSGVLVGEAARKQAPNNPTNTINFDVTCLIGRQYSDASVKNVTSKWPFEVIASQVDGFLVVVPWKSKPENFTPVQIFSMILMQVRENAKKNLGAMITNAVITVPFHFNYKQQQAINESGMIAGLNFMRIISAPAASALFYGIEKQPTKTWTPWNRKSEHNMIIYYVGAGTLDVVLATVKGSQCKVRAAAEGNLHLGGLNFDDTTVDDFVRTLTGMCLNDANMSANIVQEVILAGGSSWNPLLKPYITRYLKYKELNEKEQLETTPAYGAAIQAFFCDKREACCLSLLDVTPFSLGIQYAQGEMAVCIPKNTPFPTELFRSGTSSKWAQRRILDKIQSMNKEPEEYAIGIDFGTTYSSIAVWQRNCVRIIENEYGSRLTCSAVVFTDTGRLIGDTVHKEQVKTNSANTIPNIKRLIGKCCDQSIHNGSEFLPFEIFQCEGKNRPMISVEYMNEKKSFAPEEIAAMILSKMKEIAEAHLSKVVTKAVISVPACFSVSQRQAIKDAGVIAGLNVMQLLNEPTAAAIAYFNQKVTARSFSEKKLLIFDLGGGNLDVSILTINEGTIRVQAVAGDTNLGGEDFDNNMVVYFVQKFKEEKKRDISNKPRSLRRLRAACEKAKRVLSTNAQTVVEIDALDEDIDFRSAITRKAFEELNNDLFERSISCVERCLEDAKMNRSYIDEVVLVGGSTRIPKMQQVLQKFFNGKELCKSMNADEAVVYGAAVQAAILSGNEDSKKFNISELQDVTSRSFGLKIENGAIIVIPKHTPIKEKKEQHFVPDNPSSISMEVQECGLASSTVFNISGITPKPKENSNIIITFEVDESGILNLTAKDVSATERENNEKIVISKENDSLSGEEIEKMKEAADCYKKHDEVNKARAAALNSVENFAYKMKATARDPSVSDLAKKSLQEAANNAIAWLDTNHNAEIDVINDKKKELETIKSNLLV